MGKQTKIFLVIIVLLAVAVIASLFAFAPLANLEKKLNQEIAESLAADNSSFEIEITDLRYSFPWEFKGKGTIISRENNIFIPITKITFIPNFLTMFTGSREFRMHGGVLAGDFEGSFVLGRNPDFLLDFKSLKSSAIQQFEPEGEDVASQVEVVISGFLRIHDEVLKAESVINSIKISLPPPLSGMGGLYFYDGILNFDIIDNVLYLHKAQLQNGDVTLEVKGNIHDINDDEGLLDLKGTLYVTNPFLVEVLKLAGETPDFAFSISGPANDPKIEMETASDQKDSEGTVADPAVETMPAEAAAATTE